MFNKMVGGQSLVSWILQVILVITAWLVVDKTIPRNVPTLVVVGILIILTYMSLARDGKMRNKSKWN